MHKLIKILSKDRFTIPFAIFITLLIAYLSFVNINKVTTNLAINFSDKIGHSMAYFVLNVSWLIAMRNKKSNVFFISLLCFLYGMIIEILQGVLTTYRSAEYFDLLANTIGVLLALLVFYFFCSKKKSILT